MLPKYARLVGTNFRPTDARERVKVLTEGDELVLTSEPDNPHDSNAIRVEALDGTHLGYIQRDVAQLMTEEGFDPRGRVGMRLSPLSVLIRIYEKGNEERDSFNDGNKEHRA